MSTNCQSSSITLDGLTLDLDPQNYTPIDGARRGSIHPQVGGGTIFQDRGFDATDARISMKGKLTNQATVYSLYAIYRKVGHIFRLTDFKGNDVQCIFEPGKGLQISPLDGSNIGWEYTINLCVVSVTQWLGNSFPATS